MRVVFKKQLRLKSGKQVLAVHENADFQHFAFQEDIPTLWYLNNDVEGSGMRSGYFQIVATGEEFAEDENRDDADLVKVHATAIKDDGTVWHLVEWLDSDYDPL